MARFINPPGPGGSSDIADFVFTEGAPDEDPSSIVIANHDMAIVTTRDDEETDADISITAADDIFIEAIGDDVSINANNDVRISAYNGRIEFNPAENTIFSNADAYLLSNSPENQIATLGDIGIETAYEVQGGTLGTQPTFDGDPLFSAHYIKASSNLVYFDIQVDMDNITSFGTGQYYVTLPFPSKYGKKFREGCLHDIDTGITYHISGHVNPNSDQLLLFTSDVSGQRLSDFAFAQGEPITLTAADNFHISGEYIIDIEAP